MIIEEPFPNDSSKINSANHIDKIDPKVSENIIFRARSKSN